jgi:hypothetical protein
VKLVEVDALQPEPAQAHLHTLDQVAGAAPRILTWPVLGE